MAVDGMALGMTIAGGVLLWSGIQNVTIQDVLSQLARGTVPAKGPAESFTGSNSDSPASTPAPADTSAHSASAAANQAIARVLAAPYGWSTGQQWADLVSLWNRESGWSVTATNQSSGAYGIPQALPADKMASAGSDWQTSATTQIRWGLGYIKDTYGSPSAAWSHEESAGWY
jgi:resuscitation-promoting factor RpfB